VPARIYAVVGETDLATTHPEVAGYWAGVEGEKSPCEVTAGSGVILTWRCTNGLPHTFPRAVAKRVENAKCSVCTHHRLLSGFNDLATLYPELARDWDTEANGVGPDQVTPGNGKRHWRCEHGHTAHDTVPNRIHTHGCPQCPKEDRVMHS